MKKWSVKVFGIAAVAAMVCLLGIWQAGAYDLDDLSRLLATNSCNYCNLTRANLGGADLSGADLAWAIWIDGRQCAEGSIGECN